MQKVEYNEKLSVYKSMKRADGAGTTEQERSLRWGWSIGKKLALTGPLGEVKNLGWILFHFVSNDKHVETVQDVSDRKNYLCKVLEHDKDDLNETTNAWTEGILIHWLILFHHQSNYL